VSEKGRSELARWRANYLAFMEEALGDWDDERVTDLIERLAEMNAALRRALGSDACLAGK
jgi:DNA-binding MarR family transcriptional regulator